MKKAFLFILFFALVFCDVNSQNIDSLRVALKNAKHDTTRCNILSAMVEAENDDAVWPAYNEQLFALAQKNSNSNTALKPFYLKHLAAAISDIGYLYIIQGENKKAVECYAKSLKIQEELGDKEGVALTLNNIGGIYDTQDDYKNALEYNNKSLKIKEEIGDKIGIAISLNNIGYLYDKQGDVKKGLEYHTKSLKIKEELNDKKGIALSLNNIGNIYRKQGDFKKTLEYYNKSLKIQEEIGDKSGAATSLNNIGYLYNEKGDVKSALIFYNKSLQLYEDIGQQSGVAFCLNNIGTIYSDQDNVDKAMEYYVQSLKIREEIGEKSGIALSLNNIGNVYYKQKKYQKALEFLDKSMSMAKEIGFPESIKDAAQSLYNVYKRLGNNTKALTFYEEYITMRDSIINQENKQASFKTQLKYEFDKKTLADSLKVAEDKKVVALQLKQEQTQRYALYSGLFLVLVFAAFMVNRFRVTHKQKQIIEIKERETHHQKHLIEEKHKEITDSINYAERIQRSFLATKEQLETNLKDYFVLFQPKDVVSGDFYWSHSLNNGNFALVTADSTGHGVPGAIMSLLNISSLEKAVELGLIEPAEILNYTRQTIIERLKKDGSIEGGKDGMDCSLIILDKDKTRLIYAAANNPVWIVRNKELIELQPDKMPVGKHDRDSVSFTQHEVSIQPGDIIYTLTDGFPDQFGGPKGKKFMYKKLKEMLILISDRTVKEQHDFLKDSLKEWMGNSEQVDDVTIVGIRV